MKKTINDYIDCYNEYFIFFYENAKNEFESLRYENSSPDPIASSIESIIAYTNYIDDENANILNAGAGASSWMFRNIFKNVTCTDPNKLYLDYIQHLCKTKGLNCDNFQNDMFFDKKFDHVYFDYGNIERLPYLGSAIDLAKKSVYVDDADKREECKFYRDYVFNLCKSLKLQCFDLEGSLDEHMRSGLIIIK